MSAPTEHDIFDCLTENFRLAAESCEKLAISPKRGKLYLALRDQLLKLENLCRQAGYYRGGDARWLQIGLMMNEAHNRAGEWLRGIKQPDGSRRPLTEGQKHPLFLKLADNLRAGQKSAERLRDQKTNRTGPILPKPKQARSQRETAPVGWTKSSGGILLPA